MAIITATARLLTRSPSSEVSTRAICDAAGVQQPAIYRLFGDKDALLAATVDHSFEQYLSSKRVAPPSEDPVRDIRDGWDAHTAFALANPYAYQLMFGPGLTRRPASVKAAHDLLHGIVLRAGQAGRLLVDTDQATGIIMAANTGVALSLLTRAELYPDPSVSAHVRDITLAGLFSPAVPDADTLGPSLRSATATLAAIIEVAAPPELSGAELALLREWLRRISLNPSSKESHV